MFRQQENSHGMRGMVVPGRSGDKVLVNFGPGNYFAAFFHDGRCSHHEIQWSRRTAEQVVLGSMDNLLTTIYFYRGASMRPKEIRQYCQVTERAQDLLRVALDQLGLSARAYDRILKVSRTIADLDHSPNIQPVHVSEAIQYRSLDRNYWQ